MTRCKQADDLLRDAMRQLQATSDTPPRHIIVDGVMYDLENLTQEQAAALAPLFEGILCLNATST